ncbi:MAG: CRISPR-associated protein Cas4 [Candidatus Marinimicrobia bacterium]|nr:CRISPR-associated protein Cas4 [Candidatus Neomarinimicrobiota bacterium]MDD5583227.1 CRISPR-associated protein Cas4 [Candidatus Neomarinimicrobiota bacterium]
MSTSSIKITPSHLLSYYFCPRFIWFIYVLSIPEYEERRYKVQKGLEIHESRLKNNPDYLWKKISVQKRLGKASLQSDTLRLSGIADDIAALKDGSLAPVDFKWAVYPDYVYPGHRMQIGAYGLLIEEIYQKPVHFGYIFYIRDGSKVVEVPITADLKKRVMDSIDNILKIIEEETLPPIKQKKIRCLDCTYRNICVF